MLRPWKLGSAFGIGIYLHWSFLLLPLWILLAHRGAGLVSGTFMLAVVAALFGCVVLHELGHALAARAFGIGTRDITLYPIGGVARLDRMTENPVQELVISLAGPAVNVVIAVLLTFVLLVSTMLYPPFIVSTVAGEFLYVLMWLNVAMVVFNLIPAFPMDGGRVLRALLAMRLGYLSATRIAAWLGGVIAIVGGIVGAVYFRNPWLAVIAVFLYFAGQAELQAVEARERLRWFRRSVVEPEIVEAVEPVDDRTAAPPFAYRPQVTVYVWDKENGIWVKQGNSGWNGAV